MKIKRIDLGKDFAKDLGPRYYELGPYSGEEFRDDTLIPAIKKHDRVVVSLDAVEGFAPSFLEEAFAGIVREFGLAETNKKLRIDAVENQHWLPLIEKWMRDAELDYKRGVKNKRTRKQDN